MVVIIYLVIISWFLIVTRITPGRIRVIITLLLNVEEIYLTSITKVVILVRPIDKD